MSLSKFMKKKFLELLEKVDVVKLQQEEVLLDFMILLADLFIIRVIELLLAVDGMKTKLNILKLDLNY